MPHYRAEGYKCKYCGAVFKLPSSLGGHVTAAHTSADLDRIIAEKKALRERAHA